MSSLDTVVKNVKLSIIGDRDGILLRKVEGNYDELFGKAIPYKELGFPNVRALLLAHPQHFTVRQGQDGERVLGTADAATAHITKLVSGQKKAKKALTIRGKIPYQRTNFNSAPRFQSRGRGRGSYRGGPRGSKPEYVPPPRFADRLGTRKVVYDDSVEEYKSSGSYRTNRPNPNYCGNNYIPPPPQQAPPVPFNSSIAPAQPRPRFRPPTAPEQLPTPAQREPVQQQRQPSQPNTARQKVERAAAERGLECSVKIVDAKGGGFTALVLVGDKKYGSYDVFSTQFKAQEAACENALEDLERTTPPLSLKETDSRELVVSRIDKIVAGHTNGLFSYRIEEIYRERHNEILPDDWTELIRGYLPSENIGNNIIVYPADVTAQSKDPVFLQESGRCPSPLLLPDSPDLFVSVTSVVSPTEIYARIVQIASDESSAYGDKYDELLDLMNAYYEDFTKHRPAQIDVAGALCASYVDEVWQRVQVIKRAEGEAACYLVDVGDMENIAQKDLLYLPEEFRELPFQAIQCSLKGLEPFTNDAIAIERTQAPDVVGNTVLIRVEGKKTNPSNGKLVIEVTMFVEETNINDAIQEEIVDSLLSCPEPNPTEVLLVTITGATDDNYIYCHRPETLARLEMFMESFKTLRGLPVETNNNLDHRESLIVMTEDGAWRRAMFVNNSNSTDYVQVQLLDYGTSLVVPRQSIRSLSKIMPRLARVPPAIRCRLTVDGIQKFAQKVMQWVADSKVFLKVKYLEEGTVITDILKRKSTGDVVHLSSHFEFEMIDEVLSGGPPSRRKVVEVSPSVSPLLTPALIWQRCGSSSVSPWEFSSSAILAWPESAGAFLQQRSGILPGVGSVVEPFGIGRPPSVPRPQSAKQVIQVLGATIAPHPSPTEKMIDVFVPLTESPGRFWVQWLSERRKAYDLVSYMTDYYTTEELQLVGRDILVENVEVGKCYAYSYDSCWYRVLVTGVHGQMFSGSIIDFGDSVSGSVSSLRTLVSEYQRDPAFAVSASLYGVDIEIIQFFLGVVPSRGRAWTPDEIDLFQMLVKNKFFVAKVVAVNVLDQKLVLKLIDTSTEDDVIIADEFRRRMSELI